MTTVREMLSQKWNQLLAVLSDARVRAGLREGTVSASVPSTTPGGGERGAPGYRMCSEPAGRSLPM